MHLDGKILAVLLAGCAVSGFVPAPPPGCPNADTAGAVQIQQVLRMGDDQYQVVWSTAARTPVPAENQPVYGGRVRVLRCLPGERWLTVAHGTTANADANSASAQVEPLPPQMQSIATVGNLYWRPMAGDFVLPERLTISSKAVATPVFRFSFEKIFRNDETGAPTLELTEHGKGQLIQAASAFLGSSGSLVIEAHSRTRGPRNVLIEETQVRAHTIARFLIDALRLPEDRVIPMGLGSTELDTGMVPLSHTPEPEFIVIRMVTAASDEAFP